MSRPDVPSAVKYLEEAIALHVRHMNGTAPTTGAAGEKSQQKMMDQMREALRALKPRGDLMSLMGM